MILGHNYGILLTKTNFTICFAGIGCGHLNTVVPIWTSEIADPRLRGAFVAVQFTLALTGSTLVYWMEFGITKTQSLPFAWRFPLGFQIVFLVFIMAAAPFYPESPRHLAKSGRIDEARDILERCRVNPSKEAIDQEMEEIKDAIRLEASASATTYLDHVNCQGCIAYAAQNSTWRWRTGHAEIHWHRLYCNFL